MANHYTVSTRFAGDRSTIEADNSLAAARLFLRDQRISRVTARATGASLCDAYRRCGDAETHVGTIYYHTQE